MRSNAGMATRRRDVDLRFAPVSALRTLAWLGLAWLALNFPFSGFLCSLRWLLDPCLQCLVYGPHKHRARAVEERTAFGQSGSFDRQFRLPCT